MGRIFDDRGNPMTPSNANKGEVRYRYYVSCVLAQGRREEAGSVARVPAPEIEALVRRGLGSETDAGGDHEGRDESDRYARLERVVVRPSAVEITRRGAPSTKAGADTLIVPWSPPCHTRHRQVIGPPQADREGKAIRPIRAEARARHLEAIARARFWLDEIVAGRVAGTAEIAERERCSERSVRLTLSLAFLSPELVRAVAQGTLPHGIGVSRLTELPASWAGQKHAVLG